MQYYASYITNQLRIEWNIRNLDLEFRFNSDTVIIKCQTNKVFSRTYFSNDTNI